MKINKVEFNRFKVYKNYVEYEFNEGLILILAKNGKGKSTIADNIRLTLLNLTSATKLSELINDKSDERSFEIACEFEKDSSVYRSEMFVEEVGKKTNTNRKLFKDNELILEGATPVVEYLSKMFVPSLVDNALFMHQNTNQIIGITSSERRDLIKKMKDIDYTSKVKKEVEPEIERLKSEIIEVEKEVYSLENKTYDPKIQKPLPFFENKYKELQEQQASLSKELTLIQDRIDEKGSKKEELEKVQNIIDSNDAEIKDKEQAIISLEEKLKDLDGEKLKEKESTEAKVKSLEVEYNRLHGIGEENPLGSAYEQELVCLHMTSEEKEADIKASIEELKSDLKSYPVKRVPKYDSSSLAHYNKECSRLEAEVKSLETSISNMEKGKCPTCGRDYEASTIEEYRTNLEIKKSELFEAESISEKLSVEKQDHEDLTERVNTNKLKASEINNEISKLETELETLKTNLDKDIESARVRIDKEIENNKESLQLYKEKLANIDTVYESKTVKITSDINSYKKDAQKLSNDNLELITKKDKLQKEIDSFQIDSIDSLQKELDSITSKVKSYEDVQVENKTIKTYNKELEELKKSDKKTLDSTLKKRDKLKNLLLEYNSAKNILLKDLPNYIISQSIGKLEDDINGMIDSVYDKSLNIQFKQNRASIDLKYGTEDKRQRSCKGSLSGAESGLVNLSFVCSFNKGLGLESIFLDEIDQSMDDENAENLYNIIGEMSEDFKQTFLITHKEKMKSHLENHYNAQTIKIG